MKIVFSLLTILVVVFVAALLLRPHDGDLQPLEGLPWQIESLEDGASRVFGVTLGRDTLGSAREHLGPDMELAIVVSGDEAGALEMYYGHYRAGPFNGKLVLAGELDEATLLQLRQRAGAPKYLDSGARKYHLQPEDLSIGYAAPVVTMTFIPSVALDEEIARTRFGPPQETVRTGDGSTHLLYPALGLDLMLNERHRGVLQYVAPRDFARLRAPLPSPSAETVAK
ncbi:MAG: hypothetical protein PVJ83_01705 [Gammaproteobacteria bacterium]|jgi:hypothetical protein